MVSRPNLRAACATLLAIGLLCSPARALVSLNDGADHLYVTGTGSVAYDSNIFARAGSEGDFISSAALLLEYTRRAGLIGLNASVGVNASRFGDNTTQDFTNPVFNAEFVKSGGRTTGALKLSAARESEADALIGERTQSWSYLGDFTFKYPVIERYSFSGDLAYLNRVYDQPTALTDLKTYTVGANLLYALTSTRDLVAGYQFRRSETSSSSAYDDHSFTLGVAGQILPKLSGTVNAGYESRQARGNSTDGDYQGLTASGTLTWTVSRRLSVTGELSRDTSVTAGDQSVDSSTVGLTAQYTVNEKLAFLGNVGAGKNRFLNSLDAGRHDEYITGGTSVKYKFNTHLDCSLAYLYDRNWSTVSDSNFTRNTVTLQLSSRW
jgi:hypothetical protein